MSEPLIHNENRIKLLQKLSMTIINGEDPSQLIKTNKQLIESVTPYEIIEVEHRQIHAGVSVNAIKKTIGKVINVLFKGLKNHNWEKPKLNSFLNLLMEENSSMEKVLNNIKKELIKLNKIKPKLLLSDNEFIVFLKKQIELLKKFDSHHIKKENILFPYLEKKWQNYDALKVMWSIDDDIRNFLKEFDLFLNQKQILFKELNQKLGNLFFLTLGMKLKEELVVFPRAIETLSEKDFEEMGEQANEFGFFFPNNTAKKEIVILQNIVQEKNNMNNEDVDLITGSLNATQLLTMLNTLPVDITFVDKTDRVKYFSTPKHRIFPRTKAIIGRAVQNCHPPESVHIVEEIVERFKSGKKEVESFWIEMNGKFILIQYFAMRDEFGEYLGTLEVSMDATFARSLTGEKRLLDS